MMIDLSNFYLKILMARHEFMHLKITDIPEEIITQYKLRVIATADGYWICIL
jgi:hypothetical protein